MPRGCSGSAATGSQREAMYAQKKDAFRMKLRREVDLQTFRRAVVARARNLAMLVAILQITSVRMPGREPCNRCRFNDHRVPAMVCGRPTGPTDQEV